MTKNLNWEMSTKNLVTFRRWDGVNDEKFKHYGSSLKNPKLFLEGEGMHEKIMFFWEEWVNSLKRVAWLVCIFKRGLGKEEKKKGLCFWGDGGGGLRPQCTL